MRMPYGNHQIHGLLEREITSACVYRGQPNDADQEPQTIRADTKIESGPVTVFVRIIEPPIPTQTPIPFRGVDKI